MKHHTLSPMLTYIILLDGVKNAKGERKTYCMLSGDI